MKGPPVLISLDTADPPPGGTLAGWFLVPPPDDASAARPDATLEVRWRTSGKGDPDVGVVRSLAFPGVEPGARVDFSAELPFTPRSYDGVIVKIHWEVRVVAAWSPRKQTEGTAEFTMGLVAAPPQAEA